MRVSVSVIGAGVAGLVTATALADRGGNVTILERSAELGGNASWLGGGMLAPFCGGESAQATVVERGAKALDWWAARVPGVMRNGTLVVAPAPDVGGIDRFAPRKRGWEGVAAASVIDCRGYSARDALPELRGVRGEMLLVHTREIVLKRPVRLLHPRIPLYVVPRADGLFMIGATMLESADKGGVSVRSAIELLSAAYALHPAFGEAEIIEMRADVRPAFPDNEPRIVERGGRTYVNGFFRHGFLLAPHYAAEAADQIEASTANASSVHLGRWLIENTPLGFEIELPSRRDTSLDPISLFDDREFG